LKPKKDAALKQAEGVKREYDQMLEEHGKLNHFWSIKHDYNVYSYRLGDIPHLTP